MNISLQVGCSICRLEQYFCRAIENLSVMRVERDQRIKKKILYAVIYGENRQKSLL